MSLTPELVEQVKRAAAAGQISSTAAQNIIAWLTEPRYAEYANEVAAHIAAGKWQILDDVFWTVIPFGTGGRRGRMYPIGSNAINDRTIGESAQGLADYVKDTLGPTAKLSCAIAYDTRHRSQHFARLCAEIMTAAGYTVYFLEDFRSTPELSFTVRYKKCSCGIMVTASHNPPSDNAVKVYWSTGGQILPPHDQGIIQRVMTTQDIRRANFDDMLAGGKIVFCQEEVDAKFQQAVLTQATPGARELKVIYSPLHGVGTTAVVPVLAADGFTQVEVFGPHAKPDGDFPNVPGHVANPENPQVFDAMIERAQTAGADLALATDPDCDRIGCAAPLTFAVGRTGKSSGTQDQRASWRTLTGNQLGALLADYVLENRRAKNDLSPQHFIVQTLVTTQLVRRIGDSYGVRTVGDLLVGFKWIAGAIDQFGPERFIYGTEESHGYMAGNYVRDKDGAAASMLLCELAARLKAAGQTLHEKLDALFWQHGMHAERTISVMMPGSEGMTRMMEVMAAFRAAPPAEIAGARVAQVRDYERQVKIPASGAPEHLEGPKGDLVFLDLANEGNYVACRPSGTEPKIKFYLFTYTPPEQLANLDNAKRELEERLLRMEADLRKFAGV
ncbi:MAG TPA: phospho-sugar mutase [Lacipirellulaceae bacterium]|jgi:phosphoglucomutase/phosphomannomutase|nr:phospho-sugar mutase [Lacipirellulaceae bacterium]